MIYLVNDRVLAEMIRQTHGMIIATTLTDPTRDLLTKHLVELLDTQKKRTGLIEVDPELLSQ